MPRRIIIRFSNIIIFLVLLTTFVPMSVYYVDGLSRFIPAIRMTRILLIGILLIILARRKLRIRFLGIALFVGVMFISTFINNGTYGNFIDNYSSFILIVMCGGLYFSGRSDADKNSFIKTCLFFFTTYVILNLILMLQSPEGIFRVVYDKGDGYERSYPVHFLQTDNRMISFILPFCMIASVGYKRNVVSKFMYLAALALSVVTMVLAETATFYIGIVAFLAAMFLFPKINLTTRRARITVILLMIVQFFTQIIMTSDIALDVIESIFGRVDTVLSRFKLGQKATQAINNKPLLGYGTGESGRYFTEGVMTYWAHNFSLDLLVQGGILGYISNLFFMLSAKGPGVQIAQNSEKAQNEQNAQNAQRALMPADMLCIFAALVSILIMGNAESFVYAIEFYFVVSLLEY